MARWSFAVGPWQADPTAELTAITDRKLTWKRTDGATFGASISGRHPEAALVGSLVTDLIARRDGRPMFRGRFAVDDDDVQESAHDAALTAGDYRNVLARRLLFDDDELVTGGPWTTDVALLVNELLALTQGRPRGDLGIVTNLDRIYRQTPEVTFSAGQSIAAAIDSFAKTDPATTGFDWEIDANLELRVWPGARGSATGVVLEYGGNLSRVKRTTDPSRFANVLRANGAQDAAVAVTAEAENLASFPQGRWEAQQGYPDIGTLPLLEQAATRDLERLSTIPASYTVQFAPGRWEGPDHVWLGDTVELRCRSGRLNVAELLAIEEISLSLDDSGNETVTAVLGADLPNLARRLAAAEGRLQTLERN